MTVWRTLYHLLDRFNMAIVSFCVQAVFTRPRPAVHQSGSDAGEIREPLWRSIFTAQECYSLCQNEVCGQQWHDTRLSGQKEQGLFFVVCVYTHDHNECESSKSWPIYGEWVCVKNSKAFPSNTKLKWRIQSRVTVNIKAPLPDFPIATLVSDFPLLPKPAKGPLLVIFLWKKINKK